jgi:hypothetical protein
MFGGDPYLLRAPVYVRDLIFQTYRDDVLLCAAS